MNVISVADVLSGFCCGLVIHICLPIDLFWRPFWVDQPTWNGQSALFDNAAAFSKAIKRANHWRTQFGVVPILPWTIRIIYTQQIRSRNHHCLIWSLLGFVKIVKIVHNNIQVISAYGCLNIKMGLEPYDLLPENSYGKRAIRIAEKYFPGWTQT